jgi:hypothetical protein
MRSLHSGSPAEMTVSRASPSTYTSPRRCICWNVNHPGSIGSQ